MTVRTARPTHPLARISALDITAIVLAVLLAIPVASVCLSLFSGTGAALEHLVTTVLPDYTLIALRKPSHRSVSES